jgi:hypothetical protein
MIRVPCQESGKFVEVRQEALPADPQRIIGLLINEKAPIEYWLEVAVSHIKGLTPLVDVLP